MGKIKTLLTTQKFSKKNQNFDLGERYLSTKQGMLISEFVSVHRCPVLYKFWAWNVPRGIAESLESRKIQSSFESFKKFLFSQTVLEVFFVLRGQGVLLQDDCSFTREFSHMLIRLSQALALSVYPKSWQKAFLKYFSRKLLI